MEPNRATTLSLAQLEAYDPQAPAGRGERRFLCPACGEGKPKNSAHRCLSVNLGTGAWRCHRCQAGGKLQEYWTEPTTEGALTRRERAQQALAQVFALPPLPSVTPKSPPETQPVAQVESGTGAEALPVVTAPFSQSPPDQSSPGGEEAEGKPAHGTRSEGGSVETGRGGTWRAELHSLLPLRGTPGESYLNQRGIPADIAHLSGVRYSPSWFGRPAAVFPMRDRQGQLVGAQGRYCDGLTHPKARTGGTLGAFATVGAWGAAEIVLTEAPIDALTLAICGWPAVAVMGCNLPEWLPYRCAFRRVVVATDADEAGDKAAAAWAVPLLGLGVRVRRLRPEDAKDWNELLLQVGAEVLGELLAIAE